MKATQTERAESNALAAMRGGRVFKTFSALSFDAGRVTRGTGPAIPHSPSRPMPENVRDFNVQPADAANGDSPEQHGLATTRHWPARIPLPVKFVQHLRRTVEISTPGVRRDPESTQDLQPSNPKLAMKVTLLALMINSEPLLRLRLTRVFGADGYEVLWADTLREALTLCEQRHVDLVLVDFNRPLRSAWKDFERLNFTNPSFPVLLLTDHQTEFERSDGERVGAVLEKPFGNIVLAHTINTLLCGPPQAVSRTTPSGPGLNQTACNPSPPPRSGWAETEWNPTYEAQRVTGGR